MKLKVTNMNILNVFTICALFSLCLCPHTAHGQGDYIQGILQGFIQSQQVPSVGDFLSIVQSLFSNYQTDILRQATQTLASGLEVVSPNTTDGVCLNHTELFIKALLRSETWALRMVDAFGKPGPGIMDYSISWVGNYDECVATEATAYEDPIAKEGASTPYTGKYCTASFQLGPPTNLGQLGLNLGICVPDSCSQTDITGIVNAVTGLLPKNLTGDFPDAVVTCQEKTLEFTDKALAVSIVGGVFAVLILAASAYDVIIQHFLSNENKESHEKSCDLKSFKGMENGGYDHQGSKVNMTNGQTDVLPNGKEKNGFTNIEMAAIGNKKLTTSSYKPGIPGQLLLAFSMYTNAPKILNTTQPKGTLTSLNGIRFLSMTWVILGHTYAFGFVQMSNLATFLPEMLKRFTFQAIENATVSVDTFFVLSGLLVSFISLREMKKRGGALKMNWALFYFHRYWRLTPPYMLLLMLYVPTFKYWSEGPIWPQAGIEIDECRDTWWKNMLYINNVYEPDKQCMGWGWYLANDMQFYVISPIMLVPLYYSSVAGGVVCLLLILVNCISTGLISSHYGFHANVMFDEPEVHVMERMYLTPWTRIGPYVVGFFTGYILYRTDCKVKMSKLMNMIGWLVATAIAMSVLYGIYVPDGTAPEFPNSLSAFYNATSRTAWGLAVAWVIFACATGYGGPVNTLLSWPALIPFSRLSYCAYLVHPVIMCVYFYSKRTLAYWYDLEVIYVFLGHVCVTYAVSFVLSLAFESPMMGLEKVLLGRKKNS